MQQHEATMAEEGTDNANDTYNLQLFVTGASPNSTRAIVNIKKICDQHLTGRYALEIIDVYQQPLIAKENQVIALPMLVKLSPSPVKKLIGDMSDTDRVMRGLGLTN